MSAILEWVDGKTHTVYRRIHVVSWWTREWGWESLTIHYWWPA